MTEQNFVGQDRIDDDRRTPVTRSFNMIKQIEDLLRPGFEEAGREQKINVGWCVGTAPMDTGQVDEAGNHQYITVLTIYCRIDDPSAELGYLSSTGIYPLEGWAEEGADKVAQELVQQLVTSLPDAAAQRAAAGTHAASQGRMPPSTGMVSTNGQSGAPSDGDLDQETVAAWTRGE